jgi:hypothetical protein
MPQKELDQVKCTMFDGQQSSSDELEDGKANQSSNVAHFPQASI